MLRSRFSSNAPLIVFIVVFAVLGAQTTSAEEGDHVYLRFAGDFIQNIEQADVGPDMLPTGTTSTVGIVRAKVKGNLGQADLTVVTKVENVVPVPDDRCPAGFFKILDITDNNLVFTFQNLSLLYGDGQGAVCLNFGNFEEYAVIEGNWEGGTGRFRDAEGEFSIHIDETYLFPNTQVTAEAGTITGTLRRGN
jgi:hypothetical protein